MAKPARTVALGINHQPSAVRGVPSYRVDNSHQLPSIELMARIRILADGTSVGARNQKRGKLFEKLMASVLTRFGYRIDRIPNTNYAGMEIDIEGTHLITGHKLYCECKCYDTEIDSTKLQAFFGKYMACWLSDKRATGLFLAIPDINPHAKGFYNENCAGKPDVTVLVKNEEHVIDALVESGTICHPDVRSKAIDPELGAIGESSILVTESGIVIAQRIIPKGSLLPSHFLLFDAAGEIITDRVSIDRLLDLEPELKSFHLLEIGSQKNALLSAALIHDSQETIVEVKGGTECFEYQFPASPEHFIGRAELLEEVKGFALQIHSKASSLRGFLLEANSGWGKSSSVLACEVDPVGWTGETGD